GADWKKIKVINAGTPAAMEAAFQGGKGDYVHMQAPLVDGEVVASVGASMPPVAFSSLCCAREFQKTEAYRAFLSAYAKAKEWARTAPAGEIAAALTPFFPECAPELLASAVSRYQSLGCWQGSIEI